MRFPDNKRFAFSVFDDTDNSTVENTGPVYELLADLGIRTTKSVWVFPPRGRFTGGCLSEAMYRRWILQLQARGFEIALHGVGDGPFTREEILRGLELFRSIIGEAPAVHCNHASNPDSMYWWDDRFEWPLRCLYAFACRYRHHGPPREAGHEPTSAHFWGDAFKSSIRYTRNLTFNGINTLAYDPRMPYPVTAKPYANLWFSASDGHTVDEMKALLCERNCDRLEEEQGACIVYTHFASGFVDSRGAVNRTFQERLGYLARKDGWFVPVSTLLDHLAAQGDRKDPGYLYRSRLNVRWAGDRVLKRLRYGR